MSLIKRPQQSTDYRLEALDDELLLFHPGQTTIISCNSMAALIWRLCNGQRTTQELVDLLQAAYPEAQETIVTDVQATLQQLAQHGAIEFTSL